MVFSDEIASRKVYEAWKLYELCTWWPELSLRSLEYNIGGRTLTPAKHSSFQQSIPAKCASTRTYFQHGSSNICHDLHQKNTTSSKKILGLAWNFFKDSFHRADFNQSLQIYNGDPLYRRFDYPTWHRPRVTTLLCTFGSNKHSDIDHSRRLIIQV